MVFIKYNSSKQVNMEYCLYSPTRGYVVKKTNGGGEYYRYTLENTHTFSKEKVKIFSNLGEVQYSWRHMYLFGFVDDVPVKDMVIRIAGTVIEIPPPLL